jgi:predicted permease
MKRLSGRVRAWWRVLVRSHALERDMQDEMRFHVDMEAERLERTIGLGPAEARRQALLRFGGIEAAKEAGRDARGRQWLDAVSIDARLGLRMLWKYRGLTLVGGFAMAAAVTVGAVAFELLGQVLTPTLPFDPDGRIVSVRLHTGDGRPGPLALVTGEIVLDSFETIGAYRTVSRNLASNSGAVESVTLAEMTASGFTLAGVSPARGRHLQPQDERPSAPPVVVVGHRAWQTRFGSDSGLVGQMLVLSGVPHEVIGIMPKGFGFPIDHQFWLPFRPSLVAAAGPDGPNVHLFARLAPQVTQEQATAELTTLMAGARDPGLPGQPAPTVSTYTLSYVDLSSPGVAGILRGVQISTSLLVFVVAINLAIVLYARTVRRVAEIALRTALGASRRRILGQLFIEALALTASGAILGLTAASLVLRQLQEFARTIAGMPFWIRVELSTTTVAEVALLAVLAALIMGVLPGLRATGRGMQDHLHDIRGSQGPRLGRIWATLVVGQIAAAVAILPAAVYVALEVTRMQVGNLGFPSDRFSIAAIRLPSDNVPVEIDRMRDRYQHVMERLAAEPGVEALTFSQSVPGMGPGATIEFGNEVIATPASSRVVSRFPVAIDLLEVYDAHLLAGRGFQPADAGTDAVVVNETFVAWLTDRATALGTRFQYTSMAGQPVVNPRWHQIVGVVRDFPSVPSRLALDTPAAVYHPVSLGAVNPLVISLRFAGAPPPELGGRVRLIAAEVDPALQVSRAQPLSEFYWGFLRVWTYVSWAINLVTASALVLSAAGLYAMMAFIVAQRRREIGLRVALGATPRRLLLSIFTRAARQLGIGVALGSLLSWTVLKAAGFDPTWTTGLVIAVAGITATAGLLAAVGPARRSLRIPVAEVLKAD